jgi:hypothetical protein
MKIDFWAEKKWVGNNGATPTVFNLSVPWSRFQKYTNAHSNYAPRPHLAPAYERQPLEETVR